MAKSRETQNRNINNNNSHQSDFDLKKSLNKVNQHNSHHEPYTSADYSYESNNRGGINSEDLKNDSFTETKLFLSINDKFSDKFDNLKDDIHLTKEHIGNCNDQLRLELEAKIDKKLSTDIFYGAVSVIVIIVGIIYCLSYSNMITKVDNISGSIEKHSSSIKEFENDIESVKLDLKQYDKKLLEIEINEKIQNSKK